MVVKEQKRVGQIQVEKGKKQTVPISIEAGDEMLLSTDDRIETRVNLKKQVEAPVKKGQKVGTLSIYVNGICYDTVDIRTTESTEKEGMDAVLLRLIQQYGLLRQE